MTGIIRSNHIPILTPEWKVGTPPYPNAISASHTNLWTPSAAQDRAYNHHPILFRDPTSNRIYLLHSTSEQDEGAAGHYVRYKYTDDEGLEWSSYNTSITAWEDVDLTYTINSHVPIPSGMVLLDEVLYVIYDIELVIKNPYQLLPFGLLIQPLINGEFGTPIWLYGGNEDVRFQQASTTLKKNLFTKIIFRGNLFPWTVSINDTWPRSPFGNEYNLTEGFVSKIDNITWLRYSRGYNNLSASFIYSQTSINGIDWSMPTVSSIPNSPSKLSAIKHSSGIWIMAFNPFNYQNVTRDPLIAAFGDGLTWTSAVTIRLIEDDTPIYSGQFKLGAASYVSLIELLDHRIMAAYSIWKENIDITTFSI